MKTTHPLLGKAVNAWFDASGDDPEPVLDDMLWAAHDAALDDVLALLKMAHGRALPKEQLIVEVIAEKIETLKAVKS